MTLDYALGFLGPYITAAELVGQEPTLTVEKVTLERVDPLDEGKPAKDRLVVYFAEGKSGRGWLVNRTNAEAMREMWGRDTAGWLGKRVTLHVMNVRVGPKVEPGIRVKGSPDLDKPLEFDLKLPRKKPIRTKLVPTGKEAA